MVCLTRTLLILCSMAYFLARCTLSACAEFNLGSCASIFGSIGEAPGPASSGPSCWDPPVVVVAEAGGVTVSPMRGTGPVGIFGGNGDGSIVGSAGGSSVGRAAGRGAGIAAGNGAAGNGEGGNGAAGGDAAGAVR